MFSTFYLGLLVAVLSLAGCATQSPIWKASDIANVPHARIRLTHGDETVATVETSTIRRLVEIKRQIESAAGVGYAELLIQAGDEPNAFAGTHPQLGRVVAINTAMLRLMGTDWDSHAAIIGHEYAHHALNHGAQRQGREAVRQGIATVLGVVLGAAGVPMGNTVAEVSTTAVSTIYTRDEERDADRKGVEYMAAAGFDPQGAVRVWEKMSSAGAGFSIPFLSTHPMSSERIENMRNMAAGAAATSKRFSQASDASGATTPTQVSLIPSQPQGNDFIEKSLGARLDWQGGVFRVIQRLPWASDEIEVGDVWLSITRDGVKNQFCPSCASELSTGTLTFWVEACKRSSGVLHITTQRGTRVRQIALACM
ncbi:MAG: M48 family metallopeptidase [Sulfuricaulis sp.]|uniref:M48 family metallopeptidase n=1 Tax=Sulfuricaulis sp. TaxID=2003553 RepID=UPI0034A48716